MHCILMNNTYVFDRIRYILKAPFKRCRDPHLPDWPPSEFHRRQMLMLNFHFPSFSLLSPGTLSSTSGQAWNIFE